MGKRCEMARSPFLRLITGINSLSHSISMCSIIKAAEKSIVIYLGNTNSQRFTGYSERQLERASKFRTEG